MTALPSQPETRSFAELAEALRAKRIEVHDLRNVLTANEAFIQLAMRYLDRGDKEKALEILQRSQVKSKEALAQYNERESGEQETK